VKLCPECQYQFGDEHEFCPRHGKRLTSATVHSTPAPFGPGATTIFFSNQNEPVPREHYERLIGTILDGRYHLLEIRGEGGMGVVFKARHTVIEKIVAVKVLKRDVARDKAVLQRFVQEAKAASRIGHWSIVDVSDFGTLPDGSAYQVMEFIHGETLNKVNLAGPMWAARALPIAGQIARALFAAHEKGIVHRDLKPENIFLTEKDGRPDMVKIVDFGIAKFAPMGAMDIPTRITRAGAVFGTPEYMAPEQAAGRSDADHRVDIYALGVILYEMLVGRVPHKGDTVVATLAQQMLDPVPPPRQLNPKADVTDRIEQVVMTALAKDRDRRFQSMAEFWQGLEWAGAELGIVIEAIGGPPTTSGPVTSTPPGLRLTDRLGERTIEVDDEDTEVARRRGRRRLVAALFGVTAVAGVTAGLGLAARRTAQAPLPDAAHLVVATPDAGGRVAVAAADAGAIAVLVPDARPIAVLAPAIPDAATRVTQVVAPHPRPQPRDPGTIDERPPDPPPPITEVAGHGPDRDVVVSTSPHGASLYVHGLAAGTDGATFRRPEGTRMEVRCLFPGNDGWAPTSVAVVFDGQHRETVCTLEPRTHCVKDLKNPFKKCGD
jgi:serine/threonine-protein kinase